MTNKPVAYYIGDLAYVMLEDWDEIVSQGVYDNSKVVFTLADGRQYFMVSTMYGDGTYNDLDGNPYSVDSGTIGAIKVADIANTDALVSTLEQGLGHVITFDHELTSDEVYSEAGQINIGSVVIDTDDLEY